MRDFHDRVQGSTVQVIQGPLAGCQGIVQGTSGPTLLHVLCMFHGFPALLWLRTSAVEGDSIPNSVVDGAAEVAALAWDAGGVS